MTGEEYADRLIGLKGKTVEELLAHLIVEQEITQKILIKTHVLLDLYTQDRNAEVLHRIIKKNEPSCDNHEE